MIKGFKAFVMRGSVVDLAIAVVVGTAFAKVVDSFVGAIITPILNALPGADTSGWGFSLRSGVGFIGKDGKNTTFINLSTIVNSIIVFLMTATVVYFIFVMPMAKIQERRAKGLEPVPDAVPEDTLLLRQIRDSLVAQQN